MPRERRQHGWVEKTGKKTKTWTGYWYEYVSVDGVEKRRERCKVIGKCTELTKGAAEEKLLALIRGPKPTSNANTFSQFAQWYMEINQARWTKNWRVTIHAMFRYHILPKLGSLEAQKIRKSNIQLAINEIAANPKTQSRSFLTKCLAQMRAVFAFAMEDDLLVKNPALKVDLPPYRRVDSRFLTLAQCKRLLEVGTERDRLIVRLFMVCGFRPSELFALRADDILAGELRIDQTIVKGVVSGHTKTEGSRACVPISRELESALRSYVAEQKIEGFLFATSVGTAISPDNFLDRVLQPLGKAAGIDNLTHQMLRRTTATHFQRFGTVKDTQTLMRHSDAQTTLRHYQKVLDESLRTGVANWDEELVPRKRPGRVA